MADNADRAQEIDERAMHCFEMRGAPALGFRRSTACLDCADEIAPARLKIFPYAMRCAECQGAFEKSSA